MSKSRRGKSASANELSKWETELIQVPFNEESWRSCVFFIAPNKLEDSVFIDLLSEVVTTGLRKLFSVITYDNLIKDVKDFGKGTAPGGKGKTATAGKPPQFHEVCEQVKPLLDQGEPISPSLMAKLLKFKLLHVKQKDFERREEEKKAAKAAEAGKKDEKGRKSGRSPSAGKRSKSPGKKKGKKEADIPPSPKKDSKLKRRGDVEDTFKTIDDEPDEEGSPQHYVLIHGILTAPVIQHLTEVGVNVDAIIRVKAQNYERFAPAVPKADVHSKDGDESVREEDSETVGKEVEDSNETAKTLAAERVLHSFWSESEGLVLKAPSGHKLKDIATYEVEIKEKIVPEGSLQELDAETKTEFGTAIFEDVADTCYNMLDHLEQYKQYLDSMKLICVPIHQHSTSTTLALQSTDPLTAQSVAGTQAVDSSAPVLVDIDMRYYNHLLSSVPPESHSVPLILHCILEQVVAAVEEKNPLDQVVPPRVDGLNHDLAAYIAQKTSKLAIMYQEKQTIAEPSDNKKPRKTDESPVILQHHESLTARVHHLEPANGLDPWEAELRMLDLFPQTRLKELPRLRGREVVEREARASELRHFCQSEMGSTHFLERALKQFTFEGMLLKTVAQNGEIQDLREVDDAFKSYANLWDHPYSRLSEFQRVRFPSDEQEKVKFADELNSSPLASFRNLDDWCFVENFDRKTLIQVLEGARLTCPYVDTYYHRRDHSLLLALHNPIGPNGYSTSSWTTKLHSNVGFKNYLEHVVPSIGEWVTEQERRREQASRAPTPPPAAPVQPSIPLKIGSRYGLMTRQDVALIKAEEEEKSKKKGKKSARGTRTPGRAGTKSREKSASPDKKDEKDKDKKRENSASSRQKSASSRQKSAGRSPSAKGSLSVKSAASKGDKKGLHGRSRSNAQGEYQEEPEGHVQEEPVEEHYDFIGYDTGDNLVHVSGSLSTMFPADGGQIQINKSKYIQGTKSVSASVFKDGNMFVLHFLEPIDEILSKEEAEGSGKKEEENYHTTSEGERNKGEAGEAGELEKSEVEASEKEQHVKCAANSQPICKFSSFVAQLSDGMVMTLSGYGPSGTTRPEQPQATEDTVIGHLALTETVQPFQPAPSPQPKAGSPKARKRAEEEVKRMEEIQQQQEEERLRQEEEARQKADEEKLKKPFQHVFITCPDGQHVQYLNDNKYQSGDDRGGVIVRQSYPVRPLDAARQRPAAEETSRTVMTDGTVIKLLHDGGIQVLFPDGAVSRCQSYPIKAAPPTSKPGSAITRQDPSGTPARKNLRGAVATQKPLEEPLVPAISLPQKVPEWTSTAVDGTRVATMPSGEHVAVSRVLCSLATCQQSGQVLKTREDNVVTVERQDGTRIVEHGDGTRITTFYKQARKEVQPPDNETGEQAHYCEVTKKFVKVECIGFAAVIFDVELGSCETVYGNGAVLTTQAHGAYVLDRPDGSRLHIGVEGVVSYFDCRSQEKNTLFSVEPPIDGAQSPAGVYVMRTTSQLCCEMTDSKGTHFVVMSNGKTSVTKKEAESTREEVVSAQLESSEQKGKEPSQSGPIQVAPVSPLMPRFFVIHADGTGSELLRSIDVKDFLKRAEEDPATAVLKSPVEGHPDATGITVLRPYSGEIRKVWLKDKDLEVIIPQGLRERDFKTMPSRERKTAGAVFGTNAGVGLNVGSAVAKPVPPRVITCPRTLEFRQLLQHKPLTTEQRQQVVKAMTTYGKYLQTRQKQLESLLPEDPRDESEKMIAEELASRFIDENENSGPTSLLIGEEKRGTLEGEIRRTAVTLSDHGKNEALRSQYVNTITPDPVPPPPPPKWKRSASEWERDRIELAELDYGKYALRCKEVPPYFETTQDHGKNEALRSQYVNTITPDPVPPPPPPKWKRSASEWERDRIELAELDYGKYALRCKEVPPYFETTQGQAFLKGIYSAKVPDMEALTSELAKQTRHPPPGESSSPDTPDVVIQEHSTLSDHAAVEGVKVPASPDVPLSPEPARNGDASGVSIVGTTGASMTPKDMRPTNPTPAHATGNGTPTPIRPTNPTPSQAATTANPRPNNPTPKQASELVSQDSPLNDDSLQWRNNLASVQEVDVPSSHEAEEVVEAGPIEAEDPDQEKDMVVLSTDLTHVGPRSLYFDVTGETRTKEVKLPNCIRGTKPGALPNSQFFEVEAPVRRRVHTVSVTGGDQQRLESLRGFELLPAQVTFGVLKEGCTYEQSFHLKNVGIDSCRYKVKQPPPSTGLRVLYQPGLVAAGMSTVLDVEIFAVAVGAVGESGVGHVAHHVEIVTETDLLYLPVTATIMTVHEHEARYGDSEGGLSQGTRRVPNRPPSRDPTRPRKDDDYALLSKSQ